VVCKELLDISSVTVFPDYPALHKQSTSGGETMQEDTKRYIAVTGAIVAGTILLILAVIFYQAGFSQLVDDETRLSAIVLLGFALTVIFMAVLAIVYSVLKVSNKDQALGLPEGSVRALLAFSLVLIFVCLAGFLFSAVNNQGARTLDIVHEPQLTELKNNFIVVAEQAKNKDGKLMYEQIPDPTNPTDPTKHVDDTAHPIYRVTYYPKQTKDSVDFAKQIFTTLATIFVSVVSFYFGSSVTSSAVKAGAIAALGPDGDKQLQASLTGALADSHNAQTAVTAATEARDKAKAELDTATDSHDQAQIALKTTALQDAEQKLAAAQKDLKDNQAKVTSAQTAIKGKTTPGNQTN
jgi:hypothetical protein